jgi:hypothetical protein
VFLNHMVRKLLVLLVACTALSPVAPAIAKKEKRTCRPRHAYTIVADRQVRVYAVVQPEYRTVFACYRPTGRRIELGSFDPHDVDYPYSVTVRLSGRLVGSISSYDDKYGNGSYHLVVRDVKTRAVLHRASQSGSTAYEGEVAWTAFWLVMDRHGSVAWIAEGDGADGSRTYAVFKSDATRGSERLDLGPAIDPNSLRRDGRTVTWRNADQTRTATFER